VVGLFYTGYPAGGSLKSASHWAIVKEQVVGAVPAGATGYPYSGTLTFAEWCSNTTNPDLYVPYEVATDVTYYPYWYILGSVTAFYGDTGAGWTGRPAIEFGTISSSKFGHCTYTPIPGT
jgi:hypothetical protein